MAPAQPKMNSSAPLQVVWFKKDLRTLDHQPLASAAIAGPIFPLFLFEPALLRQPDVATQHVAFALECLADLRVQLHHLHPKLHLQVVIADAVSFFSKLAVTHNKFVLWSHEETGNRVSFERDIALHRFIKAHGIVWHELPCNGVVRRLPTRDRWSRIWDERMTKAIVTVDSNLQPASGLEPPALPALEALTIHLAISEPDKASRQKGGSQLAQELLRSFLDSRGQNYRTEMSSPLSAQDSCSRLSAHLAFGSLSIKQAVHALWVRRSQVQAMPESVRPNGLLASIKSFESRLHWHCHFIQKLESEPAIEFRNVNRLFDGLRQENSLSMFDPIQAAKFQAWCSGKTGFPMVDACMRMVCETGWLNFRMRAMLASFSAYQLWLHWREPAIFMARQFLDYEPGIHYSQFQMQSGVTGINTIRIYNPEKQFADQDPEGVFVKQWLPDLARGTYPAPIVDLKESTRFARDTIWGVRKKPESKEVSQAVYQKHGSRNPHREGRSRKRSGSAKMLADDAQIKLPAQGSLF
jgi:deoxyribodipyrimidine photo-lyase